MNKSKEFNFIENLIENKNAYIGVIGLGYVGLPLAMTFAESEFNVLGIDIDKKKVTTLNAFKMSESPKSVAAKRSKNIKEINNSKSN